MSDETEKVEGVVSLLYHVLEDSEERESVKLLGIYSSQENAERAVESYKFLPGFVDYPDGFCISDTKVDRSGWDEGFVDLSDSVEQP
jgi:hypothetical protein